MIDRRLFLTAPLALAAAASLARAADAPTLPPPSFLDPTETLPLWQGNMPGKALSPLTEVVETVPVDNVCWSRRTKGITTPKLSVFPAQNPNGSAMLILPGGGFSWEYLDLEGNEVARVLTAHGITCFVLAYRLANDNWDNRPDVGTIDAQRAMRVIRANATRFRLDPARVGIMGFSAGGFVAGALANRHTETLYPHTDDIDKLDARPKVAALIYGVLSLDPAIAWKGAAPGLFQGPPTAEQIARYAPDRTVTAATPPTFLAHADDDTAVPPANSLRFRDGLKAAGVPDELHLFVSGGHGFGMKPLPNEPYHIWPELFVNFAHREGLLG
jgi:acetyl esterase/lipase